MPENTERTVPTASPATVHSFTSISKDVHQTVSTGNAALDRVLGGGLVVGSITLIAGEPGMGKSTLLAQAAIAKADHHQDILYVTGEESPTQIHLRLERLSAKIPPTLQYLDVTDAEVIAATIAKSKPTYAIVDSVQSLKSAQASGESGSITQVKTCAAILTQAAKQSGVPILLVGQVTKEGDIAGPRVLEHVVDTVLSLEGDRMHRFRILRAIKNRFGSTDETAIMDMSEHGLELIEDPSAAFVHDRPAAPGSAIGCILEGRRPLLVELQALISPAGYSQPVRRATGLDNSRFGMILAVLTRHAGLGVYDKDVYASAAGGLVVRDTAADLAIAAAVASALKNQPLDQATAYFGEIGLTGELRAIALPELRIKEIVRMGYTKIVCPPMKQKITLKGIDVRIAKTIKDVF